MIRNQKNPIDTNYYLEGCRNVFNIFHPYDPVAYRIEPLIYRSNAGIEPLIIMHWNGGYRVQYQTKRIWKQIVNGTMRTHQNMVEAVEAQMMTLGFLDTNTNNNNDTAIAAMDFEEDINYFGQLNKGRRIDYMLQEKEIENANEYVAAFAAHSSYWQEKDLSLFVA